MNGVMGLAVGDDVKSTDEAVPIVELGVVILSLRQALSSLGCSPPTGAQRSKTRKVATRGTHSDRLHETLQ